MTRVATSMFGCIRRLRRTLGSSGIISFLCFVRSPLVGIFASPMRSVILPSTQRAEAAAYIVCYILIEAGYFINTNKSQYVPSTVVCFLGFYAILLARRFLFPRINRRSSRTCGKVFCHPPLSVLKRCNVSFLLPGGKLYVREVFNVIAQLTRSSKAAAKVQGRLRFDVA